MQVVMDLKGNCKPITVTDYSDYGTLQATWKHETVEVSLYAKTKGRSANKFEFPPPVDTMLFFGKCLLVNPHGDLTVAMWNTLYEGIMQFEDLESETESDELAVNPTKQGYEKDGFVVSDSELEEEEYI